MFSFNQFANSGKEIPVGRDQITLASSLYFSLPGDDKRFSYTTFMYRSFAPSIIASERAATIKPLSITCCFVGCAIVTCKNDDSVFIDAHFFKLFYYFTYMLIKQRDHSSSGSMRITAWEIAAAQKWLFIPKFLMIIIYQSLRRL